MKVDEKRLINLIGPNQDDPHFLENIVTNLLNLQGNKWSNKYGRRLEHSTSMERKDNHSTNYHHRALKEITNIMETLEIVDIWRQKKPRPSEIYMET